MGYNGAITGGGMAAGAGPQVKQTTPGVWAVGPWPGVAVYQHEPLGVEGHWWECQQCRLQTTAPQERGCEHIKAVVERP